MTDPIATASLDLDSDLFLRRLVRELAGMLERTVGLDDAAGYIAVVGREIGRWIDASYREALGADQLERDEVAAVLTDLKARIRGTFRLVDDQPTSLTYHNGRCPFGEQVLDHPSMCMMTSNVFGSIAAANLGYAKVQLHETIAQGDGRCVVQVHLDREAAIDEPGREYHADGVPPAPDATHAFAALTESVDALNSEIARRRATEAQLHGLLTTTVADLEATNTALRRFAGGVAHDLKGPLAALMGFASMLASDDDLEDDQQLIATQVREAARRASELVDGLLDDALATGGQEDPEPVDVAGAVDAARALLAADLNGHRLDVGELPTVLGREGTVRQVLVNLLANALRHHGPGRALIHVGARREGAHWVVTVDDDGPGVPATHRERVFDGGVRLDPDREGSGLGLAHCRAMVDGLGGDLWLEDSPLGGVSACLRLPALPAEHDQPV